MKKNWDPNKRVVVTGLGVVSSIGIGWQEFWKNLLAGKSGISEISFFDTKGYNRKRAGEVKNFEAKKYIGKMKAKYLGRASQMGIVATKLAIDDAKLNFDYLSKKNVSVFIGTTTGEIGLLEKFRDTVDVDKKGHFNNARFSVYPASSLSQSICREFGFKNQGKTFSTACAAGNYSLGHAFDSIKAGKTDISIVGGADGFSRVVFTGFSRLYAIAPEKCQPFDKNRKGMIPGEGAGILVLESFESAKKRGAKIYAEVLGYGLSCDGRHMTYPSSSGITRAIKNALENAKVGADSIEYINAHGTGTLENDKAECDAFRVLFDGRLKAIPISSIKSMIGHTMGAASALESIACCLVLKCRKIPPTINFQEKDSECDIDCIPNKFRKIHVNIALNNSQAFGGNNASVLFLGV